MNAPDGLGMVGTFVLLDVLAKGGLVVACAALVAAPLRRASAATRQGVWTGAFVVLALLPSGAGLLPQWTVVLPLAPVERVETPAVTAPFEPTADARPATLPAGPEAGAQAGVEAHARFPAGPATVVGLLYLLGCGALLLRMAMHMRRAGLMAREGARPAGALAGLVNAARRDGLLPERARVLLHAHASGPLTFGVRRPVVVLPVEARGWPPEQVRVALLHEGAHVQRGDALFHLLVRLVAVAYWPNPLVRLAAIRQQAEQERACDDHAIVAGIASDAYAHHLVRVAREGLARRRLAATASLSIAGGGLRERVAAIMDGATDRRPMSRVRVGLAMLVLLALIVPAAALEPAGAADPSVGLASIGPDQTPDRDGAAARAFEAWVLGEREHPDGVPALLNHLRDDHATVRAVSAWSLGEIKDARALQALGRVLAADTDPAVREFAALAFGEIGAPEGVPGLTAALESDPPVRPAAAWSLRRLGSVPSRGVVPWLDLDSDPPPFRTDAPRGAAAALRALASADAAERAYAAWSLGMAPDTAAVAPLIEHIRDPDPIVRAAVAWALDQINPSRS